MDQSENGEVVQTGSRASRDFQRLSEIFPEEVWLMILSKLRNSSDQINVTNSSEYLRNLLLPQATTFLFSGVYQTVALNWTGSFKDLALFTGGCRLATKSWNQDIQNFYENFADLQVSPKLVEKPEHAKNIANLTFPLRNTAGIVKFIQHFDKTHYSTLPPWRNPFLGRSVTLDDRKFHPGRNTEGLSYKLRFLENISMLLMKYGHHIWHCTICIQDQSSYMSEYYLRLCEWLHLLINLKTVEIIYYTKNGKSAVDSHLQRHITEWPMPKLRELKTMKLVNLPAPILKEITCRVNSSVKIFIQEKL